MLKEITNISINLHVLLDEFKLEPSVAYYYVFAIIIIRRRRFSCTI